MKKYTLTFILLFIFSFGYSQTTILYNEDFTGQLDQGAYYNNTTGVTEVDLSGVNWTIDITNTILDSDLDKFQVIGSGTERFIQGRDLDGPAFWLSPVIDISGFTDVTLSLDVREYNNNADNDLFETLYSIDGGAFTQVTELNGLLVNTFNTASVSQSGLTGNTLQIRVRMRNNRYQERMEFDNVEVIGTDPITPTINVNPNVVTNMGYVEGETSVIEDSFTIQGFNLTNDIVIDATATNFEISTTSGSGFGTTISLPVASNSVGLTTIYTRLVSGLTASTYSASISATSSGATNKVIDADGEVTVPIADCSQIIISEYFEPTTGADEKYIELYNPSNVAIDLSNYRIANYANGNISPISLAYLTGVVNPYSSYLISRANSTLCNNGSANLCVTNNTMNFNGNDVIALQTITGENIDVLGFIGDNSFFAQNVILSRNLDIKIPTTVYNASQWTSMASSSSNTSTLGWHNSECLCSLNTSWETTGWSNGVPDASTSVTINAPYNTALDGNITACSLTVNSGITLTVGDVSFIDIETNIVVYGNAQINVQTSGSVIQNNANAKTVIIEPINGNISVTKKTAPINNWYEYTYWSSPVEGAIIQDVLSLTNPNRRFWFNASNYQDSTMETANNGATVAGQDNVDDNGDDWQIAAGTDILLPGVGYAATLSTTSFIFPGVGYDHVFNGPFNNGIINVPVVRNDAETMDSNLNFIGNPYPSAIDIDLFFAQNVTATGLLDGSIFLWSQNTAPSGTTNGNSGLNFDTADYAEINGAAEIAGGDNVIPNRFIPSGQGFFTTFSDGYATTSGNVVFNNNMRVTGTNNQFFKTTNNINPINREAIWLNLTSDNGVRNQICISYLNGATAAFDGTFYDSFKTDPIGLYATLYSIIPGDDKKFSIQGKASSDLDLNEEIPIGITTSVDVPTIYSISIPQLEGDFFNNNTIYLEDALTNTIHDLSNSAYNFTSVPGEFNDRFKIIFNTNTLSTATLEVSAQNLSIVELQDNNVKFTLDSNALTIKNVEILDALGRKIYTFRGSENTETFNLSNLSSSVYIAKVEFSNGKIITKKAVKK